MVNTEAVLPLQAIVDLLDRRDPACLARLREAYPDIGGLLSAGQRLGDSPSLPPSLLMALAKASVGSARQEAEGLVRRITHRQRRLAIFRMVSGVVSALATGGLLAALLGEARQVALAGAVIAFVAAVLTAGQQCLEELAGGTQSLRERLDVALRQAMTVTEVEGELRLLELRADHGDLLGLVRKLNMTIAATRQIDLAMA